MISEKPSVKYAIILNILHTPDNVLSIKNMCDIAGVSRSGYYNWLQTQPERIERESRDQADFALVLQSYTKRGYKKGARSIYMGLLHLNPPVIMNIKKIRRLMKKYHLVCPVRRVRPYRKMSKSIYESLASDNLLNREFTTHGPRKVLLTDITYIPYNGQFCYLSTILDAFTRQVLSYVLSESIEVDFVLQTVQQLIAKYGVSLDEKTLIHSDQGSHYTSRKFKQIIHDYKLRQSMSRKGNCWDNSPQESFFGHMKDEIDVSPCKVFSEVKLIMDDWMDYYNNERYQWQLAKLSPNEYFYFISTGIYPLKINKIPEPPFI